MKKVMVRAWEVAREGAKKFGGKAIEYIAEALKLAWKEVKAMVEKVQMKGSEKQIKWAEDIRKDLVKIVENSKKGFIALAERKGLWNGQFKEDIEATMRVVEDLLNNDDAKWYIENFGYAAGKAGVLQKIAMKVINEKGMPWQYVNNIALYSGE